MSQSTFRTNLPLRIPLYRAHPPRGLDFRSDVQRDVAFLMDRGINIVLLLNKTYSMLTINTTERNNGTACVCTAFLRNTDMTCIPVVKL